MLRHALLVSALLVTAVASAKAGDLRLMTGPQGGSWYPLGGAIKNIVENAIPATTVQVLPGAGIANVEAVEAGKADLGFANSVSTVDTIDGKPPFDAKAQKSATSRRSTHRTSISSRWRMPASGRRRTSGARRSPPSRKVTPPRPSPRISCRPMA
jgi:hypothetical protein